MTNDQQEYSRAERGEVVKAAVKLLTGWGVPGSIARILAGAVIGAIAAIVATTASGCTADFKQTAEGLEYHHSLLPIDTTNTK